ncbi:LPS translocon maturation chaperone LptM [Caenimonas aquaedulcis]|uniref:LPS translocon maturation chaperone LptM n=1 Tax=Caenimonas aquaedulcis TaxID=2793270 RepID=UPI001E4212B3|nr:lipoprotein [Caenimonas aquaedulcis]
MRLVLQILVVPSLRRVVLAAGVVGSLAACGQRGPLFLPTGAPAENRATLTQILAPSIAPAPGAPASAPPVTGTASPLPSQ